MRRPDPNTRLRHMLDAAREAQGFAAGRERGDLDTDRMLALTLFRLLEVVGEAASAIPGDFRTAHPEIPWRAIIGMRNRLIHAYHDIDADIVWETVTHNLTPLISAIERIFNNDNNDNNAGGA